MITTQEELVDDIIERVEDLINWVSDDIYNAKASLNKRQAKFDINRRETLIKIKSLLKNCYR